MSSEAEQDDLMKILITTYDNALQTSIFNYLKNEAYVCEAALNFQEASEKLYCYEYDLVILDFSSSKEIGLNLLSEQKKKHASSAFIIISDNSSLSEKISAFDCGADDYMDKPLHLQELHSRVKAVLRRGKLNGNETLVFKKIKIDTFARVVYSQNKAISLTRREYELLQYLILNKGRVLTKERIAEYLWGDDSDLLDNFNFLYVHINNLRKKLDWQSSGYIKSIYGMGYMLVQD